MPGCLRSSRSLFRLIALFLGWGLASASAQGLVWSLPADGTWVKYAGTYKQKQERPGNPNGPLELEWIVNLTIQSVGEAMADIDGVSTQCRWLEFKLVNGKPGAGGVEAGAAIDPGPHGTRIYKVLVPVDKINGKLVDAQNLPVTYLPIVSGFKKIGSRPVEPIEEKVLQVYPVLTLFANYLDLAPNGDVVDVELKGYGSVKAKQMTGSLKLQSPTNRSVNTGDIWLSDEVPFGWAKSTVKVVREQKSQNAEEAEYAADAEIDVELSAVEKGEGAKSDLAETAPN